jgi:Type I phosphodiesterase / nucleotide pyrophosphatase
MRTAIKQRGAGCSARRGLFAAGLLAIGTLSAALPVPARATAGMVKHVLLISVDGLHAIDLQRFIASHPDSTLAALARHGIDYTQARSPAPADSFPGLLALVTGGTPAVTGVYYDVTWDRDYAPPAGACKPVGARVIYDERVDGNGPRGIDPAKLPRDPRHGCAPVEPWQYPRVNTVFDVVHAAGGYTAWADKHPAYAIIEGAHGDGVDDLYTPEIGSNGEDAGSVEDRITASIAHTEAYDAGKVRAVINEIDGLHHHGRAHAPVPELFGLNFQTINVAQKLAGYADAGGTPTPALAAALAQVDTMIGSLRAALVKRGLADSTLIIVTAKHGNGPIADQPVRHIDAASLRRAVDAAAPGELAQLTADHGALIWLRHDCFAAAVARKLEAASGELGIRKVLWGPRLALWFPSPAHDSRSPDLVVIPDDEVIYGKPGATKRVEHGGFLDDDRHVALLVSAPVLADSGLLVRTPVSTTSVAPTMLALLGLDPRKLDAVRLQSTPLLPGITDSASVQTH